MPIIPIQGFVAFTLLLSDDPVKREFVAIPQGFGVELSLVLILLFILVEIDDDCEGVAGDPHGLGIAAPVAPSLVLFPALELADSLPPVCDSINGS